MLRRILISTLAAAATLPAAALEDCGRLYMVGDATPAGWTVWHPYALDLSERGVYVYEGGLTEGELKFTNEVGNWGTVFAPAAGTTIGTDGVADSRLSGDGSDDRKWRVTTGGRYRLTVDIRGETIEAEYLGELPESIGILGDAVDCWNASEAHPAYRRDDGKYVYQTWMFRDGGGGKAFKFTTDGGATFYVPTGAETDGDIALLVPGHYTMQQATTDAYWGVADDNVMRVTVDIEAKSFDIEKVYRSYGVQSSESHTPAPLYWMAYEECFTADRALDEARFDANVVWVAENFSDAGYCMASTDGWIEGAQSTTRNGFVTKYNSGWKKSLREQADYCSEHGLEAGFYYNPLWMPRSAWEADCRVKGRDDKRAKDIAGETKFNDFIYWVDTDKDGSEQWVKGFVRHIINQGFKFLRVDFLNWYEDAYGTDRYQRAIRWMKEEARDEIWISLVMPNCYDTAWAEQRWGDMFRISEDVFGGGFDFVSDRRRGVFQPTWANWGNLFDGFVHFSSVERSKALMDGDFVRLNTCDNDNERRFWLSLLVMAGSPVAIADQYDSPRVNQFMHLYRNTELLSLAKEGFYGRPLSRDLADLDKSCVWHGTTADGDHVVAFFNRENTRRSYSFDLGLTGHEYAVDMRDVWTGENLAECRGRIDVELRPHCCRVVRFRSADSSGIEAVESGAEDTLSAHCTGGRLTVESTGALGRVRVSSVDGRTVAAATTSARTIELDAPANGLYIITADCGFIKILVK